MKQIIKLLTGRLFIIGLSILIQLIIIYSMLWNLTIYSYYFQALFTFISIIIVLWIINNNSNPSTKLPWIVLILLFPVFGAIFYIIFGKHRHRKSYRMKMEKSNNKFIENAEQNDDTINEIANENLAISNISRYIYNYSWLSPFKNTETTYLSPGEIKFEYMLKELKKAEKFIFMEYFIIEEGKMWNSILDILIEKANAGLDVRVMFDDLGCIGTLPYKYNKKLESLGIKCEIFNPFTPKISRAVNHRDHRKITVIDGKVAFNGGINLADEYINEYEKHGHWKDAAIMVKGEAVWGYTLMFLQSWNFYRNEDTDFKKFRYKTDNKTDGFIQPFMDSPLDNELVSETVYINIINTACKYVYINTPYLIVDHETVTALTMAAKRGVDVRIVTPHVPDKKFVHIITRAYYSVLIDAGVKIYEYTPGFIHSKTFVADDIMGVVGTINLDYRSLYHHFECGTFIYNANCLNDIKKDYIDTLKICTPITSEFCTNISLPTKLARAILRIFAPLM